MQNHAGFYAEIMLKPAYRHAELMLDHAETFAPREALVETTLTTKSQLLPPTSLLQLHPGRADRCGPLYALWTAVRPCFPCSAFGQD